MTRSEFKKAFSEVVALEYIDIPSEDSVEYVFSDDFLKKMDLLLIKQKKLSWNLMNTIRRNVAIIAIIVLGTIATACGVTQVIYYLHEDIANENRGEIIQEGTSEELEHVYKIYELPDGYEKTGIVKGTGFQEVTYHNKNRNKILFLQTTDANYKFRLYTQQLTKDTQMIGNVEVDIYQNKDLIGAIWVENGCYMELVYYGCNDVEDIKELILSIK